ncbi:MAG: hypothetical protein ACJ79H_06315, partial [Myxococcales bacterium]
MPRRPTLFHLVPAAAAGIASSAWAARWLYRPARSGAPPIVSPSSIAGYPAVGNAIVYFSGLALGVLFAFLLARFDADRTRAWVGRALATLSRPRVALSAGLVLFAAFVVNNSLGNPAGPVYDLFHEGETLGFKPAFRQLAHPFERTFLIHGFGMDVLPSLAADLVSRPGHGIAVARAFLMAEEAGTWIALLWLVFEVLRWAAPGERRIRTAALAAFCLAHPFFYVVTVPRSLASFCQTAATLRFLGAGPRGEARTWRQTALAFAIGASLPLALLYNYSEAVAFGGVFAAVSGIAAAQGRKTLNAWLRGAAPGIAAGIAVLLVSLGGSQVRAMLSTVMYWIEVGGWIWAQPILQTSILKQRYFWPIAGAHLLVVVYLGTRVRSSGWRDSLRADADIWTLLVLSLASTKTWIDRPDSPHLALGAILATALLVSLAVRWWVAGRSQPGARSPLIVAAGAALLVFGGGPAQFDPTAAWTKLGEYRSGQRTLDANELTGDLQESAARLGPEIRSQRCFFTLTSEGVWYYLFDKPSCSRFHQLIYARTPRTQREVVDDLRRENPGIVLFRNAGYGNWIDGITVGNSNHFV